MWIPRLRDGMAKYRAIVAALAEAVEQGELQPGDRLPTQREMAWRLGVNLSTVTKAYQEAERRHLVSCQIARGTFVLATSHEARLFALKDPPQGTVDLSTNIPSPRPGDASYAEAVAAVTTQGGQDLGAYPSAYLLERARSAVARWLEQRGLPGPFSTLQPCSGAHAGLLAVLLSLRAVEVPVLVEHVTFPGMKAVARQLGLKLVSVECDEQGMKPAALVAAARATGARIAVVVANLQNPTGATMGPARRVEMAAAARDEALVVIEDDVYGPLSGQPPLCAELGAHGILVGSLSKSVLPGLRFGFIAARGDHLAGLDEDIQTAGWLATPLSLAVGERWIADGTADAHMVWQRREIVERWRMMTASLGPSALPPAPHVWLAIPPAWNGDADAMVQLCRAQSVEVVSETLFAAAPSPARHVRICLTAAPTRGQLSAALSTLAALGLRPAR